MNQVESLPLASNAELANRDSGVGSDGASSCLSGNQMKEELVVVANLEAAVKTDAQCEQSVKLPLGCLNDDEKENKLDAIAHEEIIDGFSFLTFDFEADLKV
jgi:hypothetical protein